MIKYALIASLTIASSCKNRNFNSNTEGVTAKNDRWFASDEQRFLSFIANDKSQFCWYESKYILKKGETFPADARKRLEFEDQLFPSAQLVRKDAKPVKLQDFTKNYYHPDNTPLKIALIVTGGAIGGSALGAGLTWHPGGAIIGAFAGGFVGGQVVDRVINYFPQSELDLANVTLEKNSHEIEWKIYKAIRDAVERSPASSSALSCPSANEVYLTKKKIKG